MDVPIEALHILFTAHLAAHFSNFITSKRFYQLTIYRLSEKMCTFAHGYVCFVCQLQRLPKGMTPIVGASPFGNNVIQCLADSNNFLYNLCGHTTNYCIRCYVLCHYSPCSNYCSIANSQSRKYSGICSHPDVLANVNRSFLYVALGQASD